MSIRLSNGTEIPIEMHKVRILQKVSLLPVGERLAAIERAGFNTFQLRSREIFLDLRFVPHLPQAEYPAAALAAAVYLTSGIRGMERDTASMDRDREGRDVPSDLELVRLAVPRRVFTMSHFEYRHRPAEMALRPPQPHRRLGVL
jgi:tryptophanase